MDGLTKIVVFLAIGIVIGVLIGFGIDAMKPVPGERQFDAEFIEFESAGEGIFLAGIKIADSAVRAFDTLFLMVNGEALAFVGGDTATSSILFIKGEAPGAMPFKLIGVGKTFSASFEVWNPTPDTPKIANQAIEAPAEVEDDK